MYTYSNINSTGGYLASEIDPVLKKYSNYIQAFGYSSTLVYGTALSNPPLSNYYYSAVCTQGYSPSPLLGNSFTHG